MQLVKATLLLSVGLCSTLTAALTAEEWREHSVYQVLTDRFATTNGSTPDCWIRSYCGGTWRGLENNLDYIQGMGFDALWISPVIHNIEGNTTWGYAFHGYWGDNPYELNPHFGTSEDLMSLSDALHARNMSLMVDIVINHLAANQTPEEVDYSQYPPPFNTPEAFHPRCIIDWANQNLETENSTVFDAIVQSVVDIVQTYNVDGIRLDTARHVPRSELAAFQDAVGVFVTGETLNDSLALVASYQGPLDSVLNYPLFFGIPDTFLGRTTFEYMGALIEAEQRVFEDVNALGNFVDNHDQPRFASRVGADVVRDMNIAAFLLFTDGFPIFYYGWEQRFTGAHDPENREPLWISGYNTNATLYQYLARLHEIRALAADIYGRAAYFSQNVIVRGVGDEYMALERGPVVVVVSNVGGNGTENSFDVPSSGFAAGCPLLDLLSCETATAGGNGSFTSTPNDGEPRVWISAEVYSGSLCEGYP